MFISKEKNSFDLLIHFNFYLKTILFLNLIISLFDSFPINNFPNLLQILRSGIFILKIVSVLPNINHFLKKNYPKEDQILVH